MDEVDRLERHVAACRDEARRLQAELERLNARLGEARRRQEHMQRPSTLLSESLPQRLADLRQRALARWRRRG